MGHDAGEDGVKGAHLQSRGDISGLEEEETHTASSPRLCFPVAECKQCKYTPQYVDGQMSGVHHTP